jgi:hypothetical protein
MNSSDNTQGENGTRNIKDTYHYMVYIEECVLCGYTEKQRVRVAGKRESGKCYIDYNQTACPEHFV